MYFLFFKSSTPTGVIVYAVWDFENSVMRFLTYQEVVEYRAKIPNLRLENGVIKITNSNVGLAHIAGTQEHMAKNHLYYAIELDDGSIQLVGSSGEVFMMTRNVLEFFSRADLIINARKTKKGWRILKGGAFVTPLHRPLHHVQIAH